jgi:MFS family permease
VSHLLRTYFPLRQFAFLIGLSETPGFMVTMGGIIGLGILLVYTDWRGFITISAFVGLCISVCAWWLIPDDKPKLSAAAPYQSLSLIIKSKTQWINGAFVGLGFTIITVFAALWAVPFMQVKFAINLRVASLLDAIIFLGAGISCPLFGYLNNKLRKRRPLMIYSCLFTSFFLSVCLFFPFQSLISFSLTLFLMGISCGSYMLSYTISNEISPPGALSTSTGFTNTLAMLSAPIMQIITGSLLDWHSDFTHHYQVSDYQVALSILPGSLIIAALLVFFLPEKN